MKVNINHLPLRIWTSIEDYWRRGNIYKFTTPGYPSLAPEIHYKDGWRDYVAAVYDPATHSIGELVYNKEKDMVTREVIKLTAEEIAHREQAAEDADNSAQKRQKETADGAYMFEKFLIHVQRQFDKGSITGAQAVQTFNLLYLPLLPLKDGMFRIVQANLNAVTPPANAKVLALLNLAKDKVSEYINLNP